MELDQYIEMRDENSHYDFVLAPGDLEQVGADILLEFDLDLPFSDLFGAGREI
jgi:hypothetical protein